MIIVLLGNEDTFHLAKYIALNGDKVICQKEKITLDWLRENKVDFIVSYGYGFIITPDVIANYEKKAINLHISYLPWGKGRSPLFWDLREGSPTGATIHYIDGGIDSGDIIAQKRIYFNGNETFSQCFYQVRNAVEVLFYTFWGMIREGKVHSYKQEGKGSYHKADESYKEMLPQGWDTPIKSFAKVS